MGAGIRRNLFGKSALILVAVIPNVSPSQLKMGPGTVIVLTDATAVKVLMDKRSATTSDRPPMYIADLVTGGLNMAFARYGMSIIHL